MDLLLFFASSWLLAAIALILHFLHPRWGFAPLLLFLGGLVFFATAFPDLNFRIFSTLYFLYSSHGLIPIAIMIVLVVYVVNGTVAARSLIYSLVFINIMTFGFTMIYTLLRATDSGFANNGAIMLPRISWFIASASILAFLVDMFVIVVVYQGTRNAFPKLPKGLAAAIALLAALVSDALVYGGLVGTVSANFPENWTTDIILKALAALILAPLVSVYISQVVRRIDGHLSDDTRGTFDILFAKSQQTQLELMRTTAALTQAEVTRRRESEYFRQISINISEALWLSTPDQLQAYYVNPAYERIWGRSAASIYDDPHSFANSLHPQDKQRILNDIPTRKDGNYDVEYRIMRPDGTQRWIRDRAFAISDEQGIVRQIAGISEDITERKLAEHQQLELALEREKVKLLRDFINEASHDLKSPLAALRLKMTILRQAKDEQAREKHLLEMEHINVRMANMIDDLLMLARLEQHLNLRERLAIPTLLQEIQTTLAPLAEQKRQTLTVSNADQSLHVLGERGDLLRALMNLTQNAIYYTPEGGQVSVRARNTDSSVVIEVQDSGIGIASEDQLHIFERFFRASNARITDPSGTGLGLSIVKKVIERLNGQVNVTSTLGVGTIFTVVLPRAG
jgi:PAS domain S-box-containing protein